MKKVFFKVLIAVVFISVLFYSCKDEFKKDNGCIMVPDTQTRLINLVDTKTSSQYNNQVVATFKFTQNIKNYKPADNHSTCTTPSEYFTTLTIQNVTTKSMIFDYNINFKLNLGNWNYQGTANIPPGSSIDIGYINNSPLSINLGSFVIQSLNISYQ